MVKSLLRTGRNATSVSRRLCTPLPFYANSEFWTFNNDWNIDPTNLVGINPNTLVTHINSAVTKWNAAITCGNPLNEPNNQNVLIDGYDDLAPDGKNEILWGDLGDPLTPVGITAWTSAGQVQEADMLINEGLFIQIQGFPDFTWSNFGDAQLNPAVYDLETAVLQTTGFLYGLGFVDPNDQGNCDGLPVQIGPYAPGSGNRDLQNEDILAINALYQCGGNGFTCFGTPSNDPGVCSGNGVCASQDTCQCDLGFTGDQCQTPPPNGFTCFGIPSDNPTVCSGNGQCTSQDTCQCSSGFQGNECQTPTPQPPTPSPGIGPEIILLIVFIIFAVLCFICYVMCFQQGDNCPPKKKRYKHDIYV